MFYPIKISKVTGGFRAVSRDIPEFEVFAPSLEELKQITENGLPAAMVLYYRKKRKAIPLPSNPQEGEEQIYVPVKFQAKMQFWNYLIHNRLRVSDLVREYQLNRTELDRIIALDKDLASVDTIERALRKIGGAFTLSISR